MSARIHRIFGQVSEARTGQGVSGLRVEAWDKEERFRDVLGVATTDPQGNFQMSFDESTLREIFPDTEPEVFFKVFRGDSLIKNTKDSVVVKVHTARRVAIAVDLPEEPAAGIDRITARQALRAADFVFRSDFRGVWKETGDKVRTVTGFFTDMVKNTLTNMDIQPLKPSPRKTSEVINRDVNSAQENLAAQEITVNEVLPYKPGLNRESLTDISTFPVRLQPGQKVNLYEENGVVRYYRVVRVPPETKETPGVTPEVTAELTRLDQEVAGVKSRMNEVDQIKSQVGEMSAAAESDRETLAREVADLKAQLATMEDLRKEVAVLREESVRKDQAIKKLQADVVATRRTG